MKLAGAYLIPAPPGKVFALITDPAILTKCIEGCEQMILTSEDCYNVHLRIGVAGLKGSYVGKVQIKDKQPPQSYALLIEGKGGPGFVKTIARIQLADKGAQTHLGCEADVQVGGMIAAVGSRLIEAVARKMMDDFFRRFASQVTDGS